MKYIIQVLIAVTLFGCTDEKIFESKDDIEVIAGFTNTRTTFVEDDGVTHVTWNTGDAIGLFTKNQNNLQYTALNNESETKFSASGEKIMAKEGEKVYAYYPYSGDTENPQKIKLPNIGFQGYYDNSFDFIYASSSVNDRKVSLQFKHLFAFLKITLPVDMLMSEEDSNLGLRIFSSENIAFQDWHNEGKVYFDIEKEEIVTDGFSQSLYYHISNSPLKDQQEITCYIAILPQTEDAELRVFKWDGEPLLVKNVSPGGFKAGNVYTLYLNEDEVENIKAREREALIALYRATDGDNWTNNSNWCSDKPIHEWYGVGVVDYKFERVIHLLLDNNNLSGAIPKEIGILENLETLSLTHNKLEGVIPNNIGNLKNLKEWWCDGNNLGGSIPESIGSLKKLKELWLNGNALVGSIPENIGNLTNLERLELAGNNLTGSIPESIGNLKNAKFISLAYNQLEGSIPECFAYMPNLVDLDLYGNCFSGIVPEKLLQHPNWKKWDPELDILPQRPNYILQIESLYASTDFSKNGEVVTLQTHSKGNGITIVMMGDQFVDTDMENGDLYETKMKEAMEHYFSIEPFKSLRELFDVIMIKAVSKNNMMTGETAFSSKITDNFVIDIDKCMKYAQKAIRKENLDNVQVIMVQNCYVPIAITFLFQNGFSIANCPLGKGNTDPNDLAHPNSARTLTLHEAGGHGFGYLLDEYLLSSAISEPPSKEDIISLNQDYINYGYYANVDFVSDPEKVRWVHFIKDYRYQYEGIGLFEGASHYKKGVYRPTNSSIMNHGGLFNAPSREAIYKRAMKLAYGDSWTYDYEEFVKFDEPGRTEWINYYGINTRSVNKKTMKDYKHIPPKIFNYPAVAK